MRVLLLSLFHPELVRGGAQQICYELFNGLREREGIEPSLLAAIDQSFPSLYKVGAHITGFDGRDGEFLFLSREYDYRWHKTGDPSLAHAYAEFLRRMQPDVVHVHHFLLFGIDILTLTRKVLPSARIIFTFHEFLAICDASGHMVRKFDGSLCTRSSPVRCHQCFPDRSPEEFFVREMWFKRHLSVVDVFTTPSRFMIEHYVQWGIDRRRIHHVTNGEADYSGGARAVTDRAKRNRFGFFGQLVDSKGVWVLLQAVELLRQEGFTDFAVEINGDNLRYASEAKRNEFEAFLAKENALPFSERLVVFNGPYSVDRLGDRMGRIDWCVVPSIWWESFGLVISEAWMFKRPVIASNVGGPKERVSHGKDGLLFEVGDARALAQVMRRACTEKGLWDRLVRNITPPPAERVMTEAFLQIYADAAPLAVRRSPHRQPSAQAS